MTDSNENKQQGSDKMDDIKTAINQSEEIQNVRKALQKLQDAYTARDCENVDAFMEENYVSDDNALIIGTSGDEVCKGKEAIRQLFYDDWKYWGNVTFDLDNAYVYVRDSVAWFATDALCIMEITEDILNEKGVTYLKSIVDDEKTPARDRLLEMITYSVLNLTEQAKGSTFKWPIRVTGVLEKRDSKWLFHNFHFSFPGNRFPQVRLP
jgi:ketosteroid isomerase-like protein